MTDAGAQLRVFLVEDEPSLMYVLEESLKSLGYVVGKKAEHLEDALVHAQCEAFDVAMVDVYLHGQNSFQVADLLIERGIPFVLTTGLGTSTLPERFKRTPVMEKPFRLKDIRQAISELDPKTSD